MHFIKISVITVCYNAQSTIAACIESVIAQTYSNIEYIIIDGASTDDTLNTIKRYKDRIHYLSSEPDKGIYDAINKGIAIATGDIIGTLHADDILADDSVISLVAGAFNQTSAQILYGDLNYVDNHGRIIRRWQSGVYKHGMFNRGWMPPHPTFYCRKHLFETLGAYSLNFGTAADYELMLRFIHLNRIEAYYLPCIMVKMKVGGVSNSTLKNRGKALYNDLKAMYHNSVVFPPIALFLKPLRKLKQFL